MLVTRNWLGEYLGDIVPSQEEIVDLLMLHAFEIEGTSTVGKEEVIDVDILPNRSSDCLCHRGIAREIATLTSTNLVHDPLREPVELAPTTGKIAVTIEDPNACMRFGAALMTGVTIKESPEWLKERLAALGQRSINNVVDATNYVMFSIGQPLHAYDVAKFPQKDGMWQFGVRMAREGEKVTVLTGEEYELDPSIQVIADNAHDALAGIAGIKGGSYAEIDEKTTTIILEAANFDPTITRKAAQKLRLQTDASKRFENEVPRELVAYALRDLVKLLEDIAGGTCEGYVDTYPSKRELQAVQVTLAHINAHLGLELDAATIERIFARLGFSYTSEGEGWSVTAPFERTDINYAEDLIEEVGRVHGYEHITAVVPEPVLLTELNARHYYGEQIRTTLTELGFSEVITSSFRKKDQIRLQNALASDKGCLRSSLRKNIAEALDKNIGNTALLGLTDIRVFEIGTVFYTGEQEKEIREHVAVSLGVRTKQQGFVPKDNEILREAIQDIESVLGQSVDVAIEKGIAEFNLTTLLEKLPVPTEYVPFEKTEDIQYRPFSSYPYVTRDIALWVPVGTTAEAVEEVLNASAGEFRIRTDLFDEFEKEGRVSYAFRLVFQSQTKTLTDVEVGECMESIYIAAEDQGWEVR